MVVAAGETATLKGPLFTPLTVVVPSLSINVHAPVAVTVPVILVLDAVHIVVLALVITAVGRWFTLIVMLAQVVMKVQGAELLYRT